MYKIPVNAPAGKKVARCRAQGGRLRNHRRQPQKLVRLVAPCLNEAERIEPFLAAINPLSSQLGEYAFEIVFVNDGGTDNSLDGLLWCQLKARRIIIVDLSRNFGKEAALSAGIAHAGGTWSSQLIRICRPPELIPEMLELWHKRYKVVLARRASRKGDSESKRVSASLFYRLHNRFADWPIPENVGNFRLMDSNVMKP